MANGNTAIVTGLTEASDRSGKTFIGLVTDQGNLEISQKTANNGYRGLDANGYFSERSGPALFTGYVVLVDPAYNVVNKELLLWLRNLGVNVVLGGKMRLSNNRWGFPVPNEGEEVQFRGDRDDALCMYIEDEWGQHWYPIVFLDDNDNEVCCIRMHYDTSGGVPVFDYYLIDTDLPTYDTCWVHLSDSETMAYIFQRTKFDQSVNIKNDDYTSGRAEIDDPFVIFHWDGDDVSGHAGINNIWGLGSGLIGSQLNSVAVSSEVAPTVALSYADADSIYKLLVVLMRGWQFWTDKRIGNFIATDSAGVISLIDHVYWFNEDGDARLVGKLTGSEDVKELRFYSDDLANYYGVEIPYYFDHLDEPTYTILRFAEVTSGDVMVNFNNSQALEFIFSKIPYEGFVIGGEFEDNLGNSFRRLISISCDINSQLAVITDGSTRNVHAIKDIQGYSSSGIGYITCRFNGQMIEAQSAIESSLLVSPESNELANNLLATLIFGWQFWREPVTKVFDPYVQPTRDRSNVLCLPQINENLPIVLFKDYLGLEYPVNAYAVQRNNEGMLSATLSDKLTFPDNQDTNDALFPHSSASWGSAYTQQISPAFVSKEIAEDPAPHNVDRAIMTFSYDDYHGVFVCVNGQSVVFIQGVMCTDDGPDFSDIEVGSSVLCCVAGLMVRYVCTAEGEFDAIVDGDEAFGWLHYAFTCDSNAVVCYDHYDRMYLENVVRIVRDVDATVNGVTIGSLFDDMDTWAELEYYWYNE